jgi:NTE family protein
MIRCCLILFFAGNQLFLAAQTKPLIKNLVFEGAGIRGIAFCGVINELESSGMMQPVEKIAGTSAGAVVALTISLGYTGQEIQKIIAGTNFKKFNDGRYFFAGGIHRISKYFGWYRGRKIESWLEEIINQKTGNTEITFEDLHQKGFKDLYITGTCLNKQKLIIFSHETFPTMKVKDAVRISMSIPLYFESVFIDPDGKVIRHPKNTAGLDVMVDGGITGNFPIRIFDTASTINFATLGFRIDSDEQINYDKESKNIAPLPVGNFNQYISAFYNMVIENLNRQQLTTEDWQRTISISDGNIGPRIRKLSEQELTILIGNGRQAMKKFLN